MPDATEGAASEAAPASPAGDTPARVALRVSITYCTQCQWLLRAAWLAQELLSTFGADLAEVALVPGTGGVFLITCGNATVWERKADGGFPDAKILKGRVRDVLDPGRDLGHIDRRPAPPDSPPSTKTRGG